jgi:5-(carboxyamino)imidazole ribonucleotide mutase
VNAALLAAGMLATREPRIRQALEAWRADQTRKVLATPLPGTEGPGEAEPS